MHDPDFLSKLERRIQASAGHLCLGLDSDIERLPAALRVQKLPQFEFNKRIIDATSAFVSCYKPNVAFYEACGVAGLEALHKTLEYIPSDIPVILDAKRGDIGNTSKQYARAAFEQMQCDAITLSPYMGFDSVSPFFGYKGKCLFILCKTSNPSSSDFQNCELHNQRLLYQLVLEKVLEWQKESDATLGVVVGATHLEEIAQLREMAPNMPFLVPGVGAQGADASELVRIARGSSPSSLVVNVSRAILFDSNSDKFDQAAAKQAEIFAKKLAIIE